ncbi:MAG: peptidylprolyl isomerase [candidate division FCPU426 bacterium]
MGLFGEKTKTFEALPADATPKVSIQLENGGLIEMELYPDTAPQHVASFLDLIGKGFYDGLVFHRVVPGFVVQGGCPKGTGTGGPGYQIKAEFNERPHLSGTLAMARSSDPDSAGSQFYICLAPQPGLDGEYTVFGQVTKGFELVQEIRQGDKMVKIAVN